MLRFFVLAVLVLVRGAPVGAEPSGRIHVIDGDTIRVGETRVRLFGIDAPEVDQLCGAADSPAWPCGRWIADKVRARYEGRRANCEALNTDRYGRTVARCTVDGRDMAQEIVRQGWAFAYRRYSMDYDLDEKGAAVNRRGLHATGVQSPAAYRQAKRHLRAAPAKIGDCRIKGNISRKGERIYHVPGQKFYAETRISPQKGERWFCSEAEARAAGWRKARN